MLFNSIEFLFFLPIVFLLYWFIFKGIRSRNLFIIAASYFFYGWWDWKFLSLLVFSSSVSFASGILIEKCKQKRAVSKAKIALFINIAINLAVLFLFKYFDFFTQSFNRLFSAAGIELGWVTLNLVLPIGISFYTFQALSYAIDVYRGDMKATRDIPAYFAYLSFFPQLVAGPIERATNLIPQFLSPRSFNYSDALEGMKMILWGLFKKMVVADNCAVGVNYIFEHYGSLGSPQLWLGVILFSVQLYGDFSGYSDIASGSARLFGIRLMQNFRTPFFSQSMREYRRRWHISLSLWLRDYLYFPLGGNRCSKTRNYMNLMTVFLLSGLWHGASAVFLLWGGYHGSLVVYEAIKRNWQKGNGMAKPKEKTESPRKFKSFVLTFRVLILVALGQILFRAPNITVAWGYAKRMFTVYSYHPIPLNHTVFIWISILFIAEWFTKEREHGLDWPFAGLWRNRTIRWAVYLCLFMAILIFSGTPQQFVYFQF